MMKVKMRMRMRASPARARARTRIALMAPTTSLQTHHPPFPRPPSAGRKRASALRRAAPARCATSSGSRMQRRPRPRAEELRDFFVRTAETWVGRWVAGSMRSGVVMSGKEIRRKAFGLARYRFEEVWPLLCELREAEEAQRAVEAAAEAERAERSKGAGRKSKR